MSTKIYDAYLYKGTLHQLLPFLGRMRKHLWDEFISNVAAEWSPKDFDFGAFTDGLREMFKRGERFAVIDGAALENPACSAVVYPTQIDREDVLLVQFFGFGGDTLDKLLPKTKFRDFHYQNSSDTAVPAKEWALRKRVWDHIFRAARTPAEAGLTFDLIGEGTVYELAIRVSEKMHGHKMGQGEGCEVCAHRQALAAAKREEKR